MWNDYAAVAKSSELNIFSASEKIILCLCSRKQVSGNGALWEGI
jgi:hypothetical protein